jgi:hypothetical protein
LRFPSVPTFSPGSNRWLLCASAIIFAFSPGAQRTPAGGQDLIFKIPPVKSSINVENQPIAITASGTISWVSSNHDENVFRLELAGDLSDLQQNITPLLRAQLDRSDRCGEHIAIEHATLTPDAPSSVVVAQLHFEKWVCTKVFGKQVPNKLVGGNGVVQVKLTPAIEGNTTLRLVPEIGRVDADGPLGELLRSGQLGAALRQKITTGLLSAMQKGTNFSATLPPAVQDYATLQRAQFQNAGAGRLAVILDGEIRITAEQIQQLSKQVKQAISAK